MEFMKYSNATQSNIIPKQSFENLIHDVFNVISDTMACSLGPLGSNSTVLDGAYTSMTKDGHAIFKSIVFHNRYKKMIYNLISAPCTRLNNTVGDGTTTAIVLTNYLFEEYNGRTVTLKDKEGNVTQKHIPGQKEILNGYYRLPRQFTQAWDGVIEDIVEKVKGYSTPLSPDSYDDIYNLCYVTSNGNHEVSLAIANTYKSAKSPVIKLKDSPTNKSYISPITGFEFPSNLIDDGFARNEDLSAEEKDVYVMVLDHKIETPFFEHVLISLNEIFRNMKKRFVVIAPYYDALMINTICEQYLHYEKQKHRDWNMILTQYALGKLDPHQLSDLATVLRTKVISQELGAAMLAELQPMSEGARYEWIEKAMTDSEHLYHRIIGTAATALMSCKNGSIFRVENIDEDERYQEILRGAQRDMEEVKSTLSMERQNYSFEIAKSQARISQLKMENYIYYIGADSLLQKNILWDSIDDVVKCIRSAIKAGVVPGCQLSILKACMELVNELAGDDEPDNFTDDTKLQIAITEMIQYAVINVYNAVLRGPEGMGIIKLIPLWNRVNRDDLEAVRELYNLSEKKLGEIVKESIETYRVFDLERKQFSTSIITSAETDVNVLLAASELVKLLISGNQCLFLDSEINDSHTETREMYV